MFVRRAIDHYLKGKRSRRDVTRFLETHPDLDRLASQIGDEIHRSLHTEILLPSRGVAASGFPPLCNIPHCCLP